MQQFASRSRGGGIPPLPAGAAADVQLPGNTSRSGICGGLMQQPGFWVASLSLSVATVIDNLAVSNNLLSYHTQHLQIAFDDAIFTRKAAAELLYTTFVRRL